MTVINQNHTKVQTRLFTTGLDGYITVEFDKAELREKRV